MRNAKVVRIYLASTFFGVVLGFAVPIVSPGCGSCPPELEAAPRYRISTSRPDWVQGAAQVVVSEETILVTYETTDGSKWEVEYEVSDRFE